MQIVDDERKIENQPNTKMKNEIIIFVSEI